MFTSVGEEGRKGERESERATKAKIRRQFPSVFWPYPSQSEEVTQCWSEYDRHIDYTISLSKSWHLLHHKTV